MVETLDRIAHSPIFQNFIVGVIFASVLLLGLETYPAVRQHYGEYLDIAEAVVLSIFSLEIIIRIGAYGKKPWAFFLNLWNVFDFTIVVVCFLPSAEFAAVLRMARILRVIRLAAMVREAEIQRIKNIELTEAYQKLEEEKAKSENLLLNILPYLIAQRLKAEQSVIADHFPCVTVMFADIVGFTELSSQVAPQQIVVLLDDIFSRFDRLTEKYDIEKIKTIGDAYMVVAGVPQSKADHLYAIADMALDMLTEIDDFNREQGVSLKIRAGLHTGPVVAGVIGQKKFIYDLWGDTVNMASRMESHSLAGRIQLTESTYRRFEDDAYRFEPRGPIEVKGKGAVETYFLMGKRA